MDTRARAKRSYLMSLFLYKIKKVSTIRYKKTHRAALLLRKTNVTMSDKCGLSRQHLHLSEIRCGNVDGINLARDTGLW